nr:EpsG family protein [Pantoea sp. 201603H]
MENLNNRVLVSDDKNKFYNFSNLLYLTAGLVLIFLSPLFFLIFVGILSPVFDARFRYLFSIPVLIVAISFYASLQPFSDLAEYMNVYHQVNNGLIDIFAYPRFGYGVEILILVIMKCVGYLSNGNDQALLVAIYGIIFSYIFLICRKINSRFGLMLFCTVFLSLGFMESLSYFLRQNLSVVLFLYGVFCVKNRKSRWVYFCLSFMSHISAIVNIGVYLFAKTYGKKIDNVQRIIKALVLFLLIAGILVVFLYFSPVGKLLFDKTLNVISNSQYSLLPLPYVMVTTVNLFIILFFIRKIEQRNIVVYFLLIKEIFMFYFTLPFPAVPNRLGMILFSYPAVFLFVIYASEQSRKVLYCKNVVFLLVNLVPFLYAMSVIERKGNDYTFFNNKPITSNIYQIGDYFSHSLLEGIHYLNNGNNSSQ